MFGWYDFFFFRGEAARFLFLRQRFVFVFGDQFVVEAVVVGVPGGGGVVVVVGVVVLVGGGGCGRGI